MAQFGTWTDPTVSPPLVPLGREVSELLAGMAMSVPEADLTWLLAAAHSDAGAWRDEFSVEHDPTGIAAEANVFRYRPLPDLRVVLGEGSTRRDMLRLQLAGACAGVSVSTFFRADPAHGDGGCIPSGIAPRHACEPGERIRVVGTPPEALRREAARVGASLVEGPVLADGRREMLSVLREQAVSVTRHRFGHVEA